MDWNIPNLLTWLRIAMIPLFVGMFYLPEGSVSVEQRDFYAALLFALAAITDWLDGYLARALNQASSFGAFLDPVADKLMVAAALIVLVEFGRVGAVVALIIIGREIAISALREWMASVGKRQSVAVAMIGKIKTVAQMAAILLLLYFQPMGFIDTARLGTLLIYIAAFLTLWSMAYYLRAAWPQIRGD
jgi:CDP-diacylglycerol--glycerol-3-phosphate 3-phosphatidyltransferase/cardiolipin synthase